MSDFERYGVGAGPELAGKLVKYTSLGCYPVFYLDGAGAVMCAGCANNADSSDLPADDECRPVVGDINWEDPDLYCDDCHERIERAYAED